MVRKVISIGYMLEQSLCIMLYMSEIIHAHQGPAVDFIIPKNEKSFKVSLFLLLVFDIIHP